MYVQSVGAGATLRMYDGSSWSNACPGATVSPLVAMLMEQQQMDQNITSLLQVDLLLLVRENSFNITIAGGGGGEFSTAVVAVLVHYISMRNLHFLLQHIQ